MDGLEEAAELPVGDVVADAEALLDRVAEVEAEPDACIDDLVLDVGDSVEVLGGAEVAAARACPPGMVMSRRCVCSAAAIVSLKAGR